MTPAWIVCAWPTVQMSAQAAPELHFVHLGTSVLTPGEIGYRSMGQTLWGNPTSASVTGVAWDWVELAQGVFAMAYPLGLVTNLRLIGPRGETLSRTQVALYLNELVRTLPWQSEVERALQSEQLLNAAPH